MFFLPRCNFDALPLPDEWMIWNGPAQLEHFNIMQARWSAIPNSALRLSACTFAALEGATHHRVVVTGGSLVQADVFIPNEDRRSNHLQTSHFGFPPRSH